MATKLPVEIWQAILAGIDQPDLAVLSLVCRDLHTLVEPYLYSEFSWIPNVTFDSAGTEHPVPLHPDEIVRAPMTRTGNRAWNSVFPRPRVHLFLRSILNRHHLASNVKTLRFMTTVFPPGEPNDFRPFWGPKISSPRSGFTQSENDLALALIDDLNLDSRDEWRTVFNSGRCDIALALLLSRLSHISHLEIRLRNHDFFMPPSIGPYIQHIVASHPYNPKLHNFTDLKSVSLTVDFDENNIPYLWHRDTAFVSAYEKDIYPFFVLPYVEKLSMDWLDPEPRWIGGLPTLPALTTLILKEGRLREEMLETILRSTPKLVTLEFNAFSSLDEEDDGYLIQPYWADVVGRALGYICSTLQRLVIGFTTYNNTGDEHELGQNEDDFIKGTIGSMKHFRSLTHLQIPVQMLIRPSTNCRLEELLPVNLKVFCLNFHPDPYSLELHIELHKEFDRYLRDHSQTKYVTGDGRMGLCFRCSESDRSALQ